MLVGLGCCAAACGGGPSLQPGSPATGLPTSVPPATRGAEVRELRHDLENGFVLWEVRAAPLVEHGASFVATSAQELARRWRRYELPDPVPAVRFAEHVVLAFAEYEMCSGGLGGAEIESLRLWSDGYWQAQLGPPPRSLACPDSLAHPVALLYVLAVPRRLLFDTEPRRMIERAVAAVRDEPPTECRADQQIPAAAPETAAGIPETATHPRAPAGTTVLAVPRRRGVYLRALRDGTQVFLVRHADDTLDLFATDIAIPAQELGGMVWKRRRIGIEWDCPNRRFYALVLGSFDEFGKPVMTGSRLHLDAYDFTVLDDTTITVRPETRHPSEATGPIVLRGPGLPGPRLTPYRDLPATTVKEARELPPGTRVRVQAKCLLGDGGAHLCDEFPPAGSPVCPGGGTPVRDVSTWGRPLAISGTFSARTTSSGFEDLVWLSPPLWEVRTRRSRRRPLTVRGGASGVAGHANQSAGLGGELWITFGSTRDWPLPDASLTRKLSHALLGDGVGLGLEGRWLADPSRQEPALWLGAQPRLESGNASRRWITPSPVGVLVPELGVAVADSDAVPYVGWTLPIEWRAVSPLLRRRPFRLGDVVGLRASAFGHLPLREGSVEPTLGLTLGLEYATF